MSFSRLRRIGALLVDGETVDELGPAEASSLDKAVCQESSKNLPSRRALISLLSRISVPGSRVRDIIYHSKSSQLTMTF